MAGSCAPYALFTCRLIGYFSDNSAFGFISNDCLINQMKMGRRRRKCAIDLAVLIEESFLSQVDCESPTMPCSKRVKFLSSCDVVVVQDESKICVHGGNDSDVPSNSDCEHDNASITETEVLNETATNSDPGQYL